MAMLNNQMVIHQAMGLVPNWDGNPTAITVTGSYAEFEHVASPSPSRHGYNSRSCGTPQKPFPTSQHYHKWLGLSENAPFQTIVYQCIIMFPSFLTYRTDFLWLKSRKILLKSPSSNSSTRILNIISHHFPTIFPPFSPSFSHHRRLEGHWVRLQRHHLHPGRPQSQRRRGAHVGTHVQQ